MEYLFGTVESKNSPAGKKKKRRPTAREIVDKFSEGWIDPKVCHFTEYVRIWNVICEAILADRRARRACNRKKVGERK